MADKKYWFPAKENGFGWGKPNTWQGWGVLISYLVVIFCISLMIDPKQALLEWFAWLAISTVLLLVICYLKGEAPSWKWKPIEKEKRKWFK